MEEKDKEIRKLYDSNKELLTYIDYLEINRGKDVAHSTRKSRTLNTFMSRAQIALWFMESFGLKMKGITAMEQQTGTVHYLSVDYNNLTDGTKGFDG